MDELRIVGQRTDQRMRFGEGDLLLGSIAVDEGADGAQPVGPLGVGHLTGALDLVARMPPRQAQEPLQHTHPLDTA